VKRAQYPHATGVRKYTLINQPQFDFPNHVASCMKLMQKIGSKATTVMKKKLIIASAHSRTKTTLTLKMKKKKKNGNCSTTESRKFIEGLEEVERKYGMLLMFVASLYCYT